MANDRNPMIIPEDLPKQRRGCPSCGGAGFSGRRIYGVMHFRCGGCGNKWQGGLPQEPMDPRKPRPPEDPLSKASVDFIENSRGQVEEVRRPVNLTQEFRKGALVPSGEDDV